MSEFFVCVCVRGGAGGAKERADTELNTKTPHVKVGKSNQVWEDMMRVI